eukprot:TRINITY_DN918_c0_g1_i1.p1 TRINITY_DN918_c0_g1~~TRINITY_DN918_c0_g1_i1.p1  ORF type:complete len:428 (-),score=73.86 TRINITY_DN918_c0_g1_i1:136-1419(-)
MERVPSPKPTLQRIDHLFDDVTMYTMTPDEYSRTLDSPLPKDVFGTSRNVLPRDFRSPWLNKEQSPLLSTSPLVMRKKDEERIGAQLGKVCQRMDLPRGECRVELLMKAPIEGGCLSLRSFARQGRSAGRKSLQCQQIKLEDFNLLDPMSCHDIDLHSFSISEFHLPAPPQTQKQASFSGSTEISLLPGSTEPPSSKGSCKCKKSRCLKLYCECFANQKFCEECECIDCGNVKENEVQRAETFAVKRQKIMETEAAKRKREMRMDKLERGLNLTKEENVDSRGRKLVSLRKQCECFQAGAEGSRSCRCQKDDEDLKEFRMNPFWEEDKRGAVPLGEGFLGAIDEALKETLESARMRPVKRRQIGQFNSFVELQTTRVAPNQESFCKTLLVEDKTCEVMQPIQEGRGVKRVTLGAFSSLSLSAFASLD